MPTASPRHAAPLWLRRLLRRRADRLQNLWSTLLVLATMASCAWLAQPDFDLPSARTAEATHQQMALARLAPIGRP
ncbi:hypothetical protein RA210_U10681 [Rubrivivax sp. A210]|uniref:hypothetical protein n=1 Tax=Rubrivivax sp. A210 TaxID=2772301 RepID=UPI00191B4DB1|nr:hypothetical protein [Rubrivivax sp. A210]CAD5367160.1 hypothetical protein RA210_U10681 [Rubrivivax sp. A210]